MDVEILSRVQFALTVSFHYLFPPLTIGLGMVMVIIETMWIRTGDRQWFEAARFWTRIFAVNFALGVATGIVMEFQFGTNWAAYSRYVGDIFGSALAAEGIFAFFLESGFLAILVFGWDRVGRKLHYFSTWMVCLGSMFSAVWIIIANSWMHTPAGFHLVPAPDTGVAGVRAEVTDFWAMVFNPSSMTRLSHVLCSAVVTGGFLVMSVCAFYMLRGRHKEFTRRCMPVGVAVALAGVVLIGITGDRSARGVAVQQPAKLAAFEAVFKTEPSGLYLFGWPDPENQTVYGVKIPGLLSYMLYFDASKPVTGLDAFAPEDRPNMRIPFLAFHVMVILAGIMTMLAALAAWFAWRGTLDRRRLLLKVLVPSVVMPTIAGQAGWYLAETGRQPWIVYPSVQDGKNVPGLRVSDALSEAVTAEQVVASIIMFGLIYLMLFALWIFVLDRKIRHGPSEPKVGEEPPPMHGPPGGVAAAIAGGKTLTGAH
jgi:cytochrome d ubiquinol oxidase subunit I